MLVAARVPGAPQFDVARGTLSKAFAGTEPLRISRQILREYLAAVTRPQSWSLPLGMAEALRDVERMSALFEILEDGPRVTGLLEELCREVSVAGKQIHDANIVATMLAHGERRLVTLNGRDFRRFGDRLELVPVVE